MTTDLVWLTLSAVLAASLWLPYVVGAARTRGPVPADFVRPPDLREMAPWIHRAHRAHLNTMETLAPFAAVVLVAQAAGVSTVVTATASVAFFWLRLAHAVGMIAGWAGYPLRPMLCTASWLCTLALAAALLAA